MAESVKCDATVEVWARCVGYFAPVRRWHKGKQSEYNDRKEYVVKEVGVSDG